MKIAVDAMGGDFAPEQVVKGAILADKQFQCEIVLVGDQAKIEAVLNKEYPQWRKSKITVHHAGDIIEMDEHPGATIRRKPDASIVVATRLVKDGLCDAVVSAGNTGAAVACALLFLGRIKGIDRPAIATPMPNGKGSVTLLMDSGAQVDSKPRNLSQTAYMGSIYAKCIYGKQSPKVGLLNIGEESTKGNEQAQTTYPILEAMHTINFAGNAEGRDIPAGNFDVVVCDGFVGNVVLKFAEGLANTLVKLAKDAIKNGGILAKLGALMLIPALKKLSKDIDVSEYGGAPLLGVNGCCIISHGSSNAKAVCNAIRQARDYVQNEVLAQIRDNIDKEEFNRDDSENA